MKLINFRSKKDTEFEDLLTKISSFNGTLEGSDIPQLFTNAERVFGEKRIKEICASFQENPLETLRGGLEDYERARKLSRMMKEQSGRILENYFGNGRRIDMVLSDERTINELLQLGLMVFACGIELHETGTTGSGYLYRLMGEEYRKDYIVSRLIGHTEKRGYIEENQRLKEALDILKRIYFQVHDHKNPDNFLGYAHNLREKACKLFEEFYRRKLLSFEQCSELKMAFDDGKLRDDDMAWVKYSRPDVVTVNA